MKRNSFSKKSIDEISELSCVKKLKNENDRLIVNYNELNEQYEVLGVALEFRNYISAKGFKKESSFGKSFLDEFIEPKFIDGPTFRPSIGGGVEIDPTKLLEKLNNCMKMIKESLDKEDKGNSYVLTVYYNRNDNGPEEEIKKFKDCVLRFYNIDLDKTNVQIKASL